MAPLVNGIECAGEVIEYGPTIGDETQLAAGTRAGWCGRSPNPNDARSSVLTLSPAGRRVLDAAQGALDDELAARLGAAVSPVRLASFATTVRDLRKHITEQPERAR